MFIVFSVVIILYYFIGLSNNWPDQLEDAIDKLQQAMLKQTIMCCAHAFQFYRADEENDFAKVSHIKIKDATQSPNSKQRNSWSSVSTNGVVHWKGTVNPS